MHPFAIRPSLTVLAAGVALAGLTPYARALPPPPRPLRPPPTGHAPARPAAVPVNPQPPAPAVRNVPLLQPVRPPVSQPAAREQVPRVTPGPLPTPAVVNPSALPRIPVPPPRVRTTLPPAPTPGGFTFNGNLAAQRAFQVPPFRIASVVSPVVLPSQFALAGTTTENLLLLATLNQALAATLARTSLSGMYGAMVNPYGQGSYMPAYSPYGGGNTYSSGGYGTGVGVMSGTVGPQTGAGGASGQQAATQEVALYDNFFAPLTVSVKPGTTVRWTNTGFHHHTVTSQTGVWESGALDRGATFTFTFRQRGTYPYYCRFHSQEMRGTVVVD